MLTPSVLLLTLQINSDEPLLSFQPGQYAAISFKYGLRPTAARCFSIASPPTEQGILQFGIRIQGHFTRALTKLKIGDEVSVRGPFGEFVLDAHSYNDVVLCAGGIGITPFMSMIRFASKTQLNNKLTLILSARNQDEVPFADELRGIAERSENIKIIYSISDGPTDKLPANQAHIGRISPELLSDVVDNHFASKTFFVCGPPPFMNSVNKMLLAHGVSYSQIRTEAFSQGPHKQTGKLRSWPINIYLLGAVGTAAASFIVMAGDLLKTLPNAIMPSSLTTETPLASNSRQSDLDALVNSLSAQATTATDSPAVIAANKAVSDAKSQQAGTVAATPASSSNNNSTSTNKPSSTPTPVVSTPAPAPAPAPICTTSPSGVTTCR